MLPDKTLQSWTHNPQTERERQIAQLAPWFHNLHLPDGAQTAPDHPLGDFPLFKWRKIAPLLPESLAGWRVLDIGCNAGFYCFELARRGARVTGIDLDPHYLAQARWAAGEFDLEDRIEFRQMQIYDLAREDEEYDLILFLGVLYHLRYPLLRLDIVSRKARRLLLVQSLMTPGEAVCSETRDLKLDDCVRLTRPDWPAMAFIEHRLEDDPTNWWVPNHACMEAMLRSCGLRILTRPDREIYLCQPDMTSEAYEANLSELRAATGQIWA